MKRPGLLLPIAALLIITGCGTAANVNAPGEIAQSKSASAQSGQDPQLPVTDPPDQEAFFPFSPLRPLFSILPFFPW